MWNRDSTVTREETRASEMVQPTGVPLSVEEKSVVACVGKSVVFKGTLTSSEDITIDGHVEGSIEVRDQGVTVGPDAEIRAGIIAKVVTIHGAVIGNIRASAKIDVRATGRIKGDLVAPRIVITDGAVVGGRVDTSTEQSDTANLRAQLAIV